MKPLQYGTFLNTEPVQYGTILNTEPANMEPVQIQNPDMEPSNTEPR